MTLIGLLATLALLLVGPSGVSFVSAGNCPRVSEILTIVGVATTPTGDDQKLLEAVNQWAAKERLGSCVELVRRIQQYSVNPTEEAHWHLLEQLAPQDGAVGQPCYITQAQIDAVRDAGVGAASYNPIADHVRLILDHSACLGHSRQLLQTEIRNKFSDASSAFHDCEAATCTGSGGGVPSVPTNNNPAPSVQSQLPPDQADNELTTVLLFPSAWPCSVDGIPGKCVPVETCNRHAGRHTAGYCPGGDEIQCCHRGAPASQITSPPRTDPHICFPGSNGRGCCVPESDCLAAKGKPQRSFTCQAAGNGGEAQQPNPGAPENPTEPSPPQEPSVQDNPPSEEEDPSLQQQNPVPEDEQPVQTEDDGGAGVQQDLPPEDAPTSETIKPEPDSEGFFNNDEAGSKPEANGEGETETEGKSESAEGETNFLQLDERLRMDNKQRRAKHLKQTQQTKQQQQHRFSARKAKEGCCPEGQLCCDYPVLPEPCHTPTDLECRPHWEKL